MMGDWLLWVHAMSSQAREFLKPALQIVAALVEILCSTSLRNKSCE
jgi:hypothetical protein